jgi:hypothetical protein
VETISKDGFLRIPNNKYADDNIVKSYKGRQIELGKDILVYKNLHKKCYSIKQHGKVVAHADRLCLMDVTFKVSEKLRQKVLATKQKNVHAFVCGLYTTSGMGTTAKRNDLPVEVYYNPYKVKAFTTKAFTPEFELKGAMFAILDEEAVKCSYTR